MPVREVTPVREVRLADGVRPVYEVTPVGIYREVGYKLGCWRDVGWWQLALGERVADPEAPLDFKCVRPTVNWDRW